jgi:site-specific recombinase XerD
MNVKLSIYHDTRRVKLNAKYPVKLRITCKGERRYYPLPDKNDLSEADYEVVFHGDPRKKLKDIKKAINAEETRAQEIIDSLGHKFSFALFEKMFRQKRGDKNLISLLDGRAKILRKEGRIGTASLFELTSKSLQEFYGKKVIDLDAVDANFLNEYERWMIKEKRSITTVGIYARNIRTIFNASILEKLIPADLYPFGLEKNNLYTIPTGKNIKRGLPPNDLELIVNYKTENESISQAKDFWLFTYFGNGINMKDIALLKFKNINKQENTINFERAKTRRSNKGNPVVISFYMSDEINRIIRKWGNKSLYDGNYIFPILTNSMNVDEVDKKIALFIAFVNKNMRKVAEDIKLTDSNPTTKVARHSFAHHLVNNGFAPHAVGKTMGHGSTKTTDNYFGNTSTELKKNVSRALTKFEKAVES